MVTPNTLAAQQHRLYCELSEANPNYPPETVQDLVDMLWSDTEGRYWERSDVVREELVRNAIEELVPTRLTPAQRSIRIHTSIARRNPRLSGLQIAAITEAISIDTSEGFDGDEDHQEATISESLAAGVGKDALYDTIREENPDLNLTALTTVCNVLWRQLREEGGALETSDLQIGQMELHRLRQQLEELPDTTTDQVLETINQVAQVLDRNGAIPRNIDPTPTQNPTQSEVPPNELNFMEPPAEAQRGSVQFRYVTTTQLAGSPPAWEQMRERPMRTPNETPEEMFGRVQLLNPHASLLSVNDTVLRSTGVDVLGQLAQQHRTFSGNLDVNALRRSFTGSNPQATVAEIEAFVHAVTQVYQQLQAASEGTEDVFQDEEDLLDDDIDDGAPIDPSQPIHADQLARMMRRAAIEAGINPDNVAPIGRPRPAVADPFRVQPTPRPVVNAQPVGSTPVHPSPAPANTGADANTPEVVQRLQGQILNMRRQLDEQASTLQERDRRINELEARMSGAEEQQLRQLVSTYMQWTRIHSFSPENRLASEHATTNVNRLLARMRRITILTLHLQTMIQQAITGEEAPSREQVVEIMDQLVRFSDINVCPLSAEDLVDCPWDSTTQALLQRRWEHFVSNHVGLEVPQTLRIGDREVRTPAS